MSETPDSIGVHNVAYLERMYADFRRDPQSVPAEWQKHFASAVNGNGGELRLGPSFHARSVFNPEASARTAGAMNADVPPNLSDRLYQLVRNYRVRGHKIAAIDPLGRPRECPPELKPEYYNFTEAELDQLVNLPTFSYDTPLSIREIIQRLRNTYCRSIGVQFMHIDEGSVREWLQKRMEGTQNHLLLSHEEQVRILTRLTDATIFEEFLRRKFLGAKTFSLEGCETLLPLLDLAIEKAGDQHVGSVVIGMGHRGRLNVLAHIIGKPIADIFREFADDEPEFWVGRGDVKYHLGHSGEWTTGHGRRLHVSLCFNPSHLEFVNPVVMGRVRAQQDRLGDRERERVLGIVIHGDAAFAGEGVVQETLNLARLPGYAIGGVLHIIVNNQIGFTTSPEEGRSTTYATDVARMLRAPIFHVNGEDPEAVAQVVRLAMDFRHEFKTDVFIDMYGYRRWGHNETDEPSFTQPALYRAIAGRPNVREAYLEHLLELGEVTKTEAGEIAQQRHDLLEGELAASRAGQRATKFSGGWESHAGGPEPKDEPDTGIAAERVSSLLRKLTEMPQGFHLHRKLEHGFEKRREMAAGKLPLDWAAAEALAFASLATDGVQVRLAGQDSGRGTFSHRHAFLHDQETDFVFAPLQHLSSDQAPVEIYNSPLCETAALGFEYGFSLDCPDGLVIWEAQFGDFVNVAQVIIDQFITSAEDKWRRLSGLVMLLPHGFEGMGPEHSSARLERFLTLAAEDNIQIVQPTTPAQLFHVLRRQCVRQWRKPLVVLTPKSLLRRPEVVSPFAEFTTGHFQRILTDDRPPEGVKRILLCTGKIFYDLAAYREKNARRDVAILRVEQLYPLRTEALEEALKSYAGGTPVFWVQEEPENMGAWRYLNARLGKELSGRPFTVESRPESASPATGSGHAHKLEQARLVARAFGAAEPGVEEVLKKEKAAGQDKEK